MTPLEHENFWHRQVTEHLDFLGLLFTDPIEKAEATRLRAVYGPALGSARKALTVNVVAWQEHLLARLRGGEFLGWAFPLLVEHMQTETRLLQWLAWDAAPEPELGLAATLAQIGAEHALFAAHLLDPTERALVAAANEAADGLYTISLDLSKGEDIEAMAAEDMKALGAWLVEHKIGHGGAPSIVPAALADHVVREQDYGDFVLREGR